MNFNRNKARFIQGKHYFSATHAEVTNCYPENYKGNQGLNLFTQRGVALLAKSLNTDTAWSLYEQMVDSYFDDHIEVYDQTIPRPEPEPLPYQDVYKDKYLNLLEETLVLVKKEAQINSQQPTLASTTNSSRAYKRYTQEEINKILVLHAQGLSHREIGLQVNRGLHGIAKIVQAARRAA